jgi:hypothetical protein
MRRETPLPADEGRGMGLVTSLFGAAGAEL